jgi:hypothetical protein
MHGSLGDFQALSQGATRHAPMGLQQKQRGEQPVGFQRPPRSSYFLF